MKEVIGLVYTGLYILYILGEVDFGAESLLHFLSEGRLTNKANDKCLNNE